jgi:hypothetical protein
MIGPRAHYLTDPAKTALPVRLKLFLNDGKVRSEHILVEASSLSDISDLHANL